MYLTNDETGEVGEFNKPQPGWSDSTQEEIDACMLQCAKESKLKELDVDKGEFEETGYEYDGDVACWGWNSEESYDKYAFVWNVDLGLKYVSLQSGNIGNIPASSPLYWEPYTPTFKTDSDCMIDLTVKDGLSSGSAYEYRYFDKPRESGVSLHLDFEDLAGWQSFTEAMRDEYDKIMFKYRSYKNLIALCETTAAVEAITIDFS